MPRIILALGLGVILSGCANAGATPLKGSGDPLANILAADARSVNNCKPEARRAADAQAVEDRCFAILDHIRARKQIMAAAYISGGAYAYRRADEVTAFTDDDFNWYRATCESKEQMTAVISARRHADDMRNACGARAR